MPSGRKLDPLRLRSMTEAETAWVAGVLEGEGCFRAVLHPQRPNWQPRIHVNMTDLDVLERLQAVTGVGSITSKKGARPAHHKQQWIWNVQARRDAAALMLAVKPFMLARRTAKIEEVIATCGPSMRPPMT